MIPAFTAPPVPLDTLAPSYFDATATTEQTGPAEWLYTIRVGEYTVRCRFGFDAAGRLVVDEIDV